MKVIRVIATRTISQSADVLIRAPDWLTNKDQKMYDEYISDMAYDIANIDDSWETNDVFDDNWEVVADPYKEGQP
tara:strand:+ start:434 stop:658 length:225 start_codon:yes stop_codon:yes gene_type:complete